jgi:hypothetical protein
MRFYSEVQSKIMRRLFKIIGAVIIVALTLAAVAESSAQWENTEWQARFIDETFLCQRALNSERSGWDDNSDSSLYVAEAARRGLSVDACRQMVGPPPPTSNRRTSREGGTSEQRAFLEAALFFITGVDAASDEIVGNREIVLRQYPIVAYLVDSNSCAVRIRTTTQPYIVWQMDFCKITHYEQSTRYGNVTVYWLGYKTAFCTYKGWNKDENYTGTIGELDSKCTVYGVGSSGEDPEGPEHIAWSSMLDVRTLFNGDAHTGRSVDRMIAAFKNIRMLVTPPEQRKPY